MKGEMGTVRGDAMIEYDWDGYDGFSVMIYRFGMRSTEQSGRQQCKHI